MKKAIFFTVRYPFYTVGENFFQSELEGVAPGYDEVYVVCCDSNLKNPEIKMELPENVTAVHLKSGNRKLNLLSSCIRCPFTKTFWREFRQFCSEKRPFLASLKTLVYSSSIYFAILKNFPTIAKAVNIQPDDEVILVGYWLHYIAQAALKFREYIKRPDIKVVSRAHGSADVQNLTRLTHFYPFQKHLLENLDGVLAISNKGRDYLRSMSSRPEIVSRVYIGSYGADEFIMHRRDPFTIVSCSFFIPLKRVDIIAGAVKILLKEYPEIRWVHFGDGPQRKAIEDSCADIKESIDFRGRTPHEEVLGFLASGEPSVFVHASASEGLPVSIMEALGYSTPVIATDVNATNEAVITGVSGTLTEADITPEKLAQYIKQYIVMPDEEYNALCKSTFEYWHSTLDCRSNSKLLLKELKQF